MHASVTCAQLGGRSRYRYNKYYTLSNYREGLLPAYCDVIHDKLTERDCRCVTTVFGRRESAYYGFALLIFRSRNSHNKHNSKCSLRCTHKIRSCGPVVTARARSAAITSHLGISFVARAELN